MADCDDQKGTRSGVPGLSAEQEKQLALEALDPNVPAVTFSEKINKLKILRGLGS